jgi:hypothetical protein
LPLWETDEKDRPVRQLIGIGLSFLLSMTTVAAQLPPPAQAAVDAYRSAIAAAVSKPRTHGVEHALAAFHELQAALTRKDLLESLTDQQFAEVRALKGVVANRDEVVYVQPDVAYFRGLARTGGDAADRAFFEALKATYPDSVWPVYVEQQTDAGGCTRFGNRSVVGAYVRWSDFLHRHPGRYRDDATKELDAAFEALTRSTCACGEPATVEQELQYFLRTVHQSAPRAAVQERLQSVRAGRSGIRARCVGGQ